MSKNKDKTGWTKRAEAELRNKSVNDLARVTPENITVEPLYTAADLDGLGHLDSHPGQAPFTRGIRATMYTNRPWTIRQYAGFQRQKKPTHFSAKPWQQARKVCQLRSIWPLTAVMILTISGSEVMLGKLALPSILSKI